MLAYVVFAYESHTWVQITKAVLLVMASILLVMLCGTLRLLVCQATASVVGDAKVQGQVAKLLAMLLPR